MIAYSAAAQTALAATILFCIDGGAGAGVIEIYGGSRPSSPDAPLTGQPLLARLNFSAEAGRVGIGESYKEIEPAAVLQSGRASWARISNAGRAVADLDVGEQPAGDISLNTTELRVGGPVKLEAIGFLEMGRQRKAATSTTTLADDLDAAIPR